MSNYLNGYNSVIKLAEIQIFDDKDPYTLGALGKEHDRNYLPYALPEGLGSATAGGLLLGTGVSAATGKSPVQLATVPFKGNYSDISKDIKSHVRNVTGYDHIKNIKPKDFMRKSYSRSIEDTSNELSKGFNNYLRSTNPKRLAVQGAKGAAGGLATATGLTLANNASQYYTGQSLAPGEDGNVRSGGSDNELNLFKRLFHE